MIRLILMAAAVFMISCSTTENEPESVATEKFPNSILENATITLTSEGRKDAVIYADSLISYEEEDSTIAKIVKVDFYGEDGEYRSTLTSHEGLVRQKRNEFTVWGNVVVENDTARLETESLRWDPRTRLISTDDFVKFHREEDVLTGYGMKADSRLDNVEILRGVKGKFTEMPKTEEELNELEGEPEKEIEP